MAETTKKKAVKKVSVPKLANYKNTTNRNIFTESGRCAPNGVVALFPEQAKSYKGLEKCATK